jgi:hypothetical protein
MIPCNAPIPAASYALNMESRPNGIKSKIEAARSKRYNLLELHYFIVIMDAMQLF